ncbi:HAD family hydrolase [soil metagenome]
MSNRAVFVDRDGTLVEARHYPSRPEDLVLYHGICDELRRVQEHGFLLVLITNQSGIARGYFTEHDLTCMHDDLCERLQRNGVTIDAIYFCPHHVDGVIEDLAIECDCRKPKPGMLLRAASDLDIDLSRSWFVGDILDDIEAGKCAGCKTVLVDLGTESLPQSAMRWPDVVARDAVHAMQIIQSSEGIGCSVADDYLPPDWQRVETQTGVAHADD